jgi:CheY-like chemotaxis protein
MNRLDILLVEDSINDKLLLEAYLTKKAGVTIVYHAANGQEALDYLGDPNSKQPNLIILDVQMPVMDGYACLKAIRRSVNHRKVPVLMMTNMVGDSYIEKSFSNCASGHIEKPGSPRDYKETVESLYTYWSSTTKLPT